MSGWNLLRITALLTGAVMAGEAAALVIGMRPLGAPSNPLASPNNDLLLALHILAGLALVWVAWFNPNAAQSNVYWKLTVAALLSPGFRDWELLTTWSNPFLFNKPLFVVNNLKLVG